MPQVFGSDELDLMHEASMWFETGAMSEQDIEKATHPMIAQEARARGLVPLRMGRHPIWYHPDSGKQTALIGSHGGRGSDRASNVVASMTALKREFPTPDEIARASRLPEQVDVDAANAAERTRAKKQKAVDAAKNRAAQEAQLKFRRLHAPFKSQDEVQQAFDARSENARLARPDETVEQYTQRLRDAPPDVRQQLHRMTFPERY